MSADIFLVNSILLPVPWNTVTKCLQLEKEANGHATSAKTEKASAPTKVQPEPEKPKAVVDGVKKTGKSKAVAKESPVTTKKLKARLYISLYCQFLLISFTESYIGCLRLKVSMVSILCCIIFSVSPTASQQELVQYRFLRCDWLI